MKEVINKSSLFNDLMFVRDLKKSVPAQVVEAHKNEITKNKTKQTNKQTIKKSETMILTVVPRGLNCEEQLKRSSRHFPNISL